MCFLETALQNEYSDLHTCCMFVAGMGVAKLYSQSRSQMEVLWYGYGNSPETPDNAGNAPNRATLVIFQVHDTL